MEQQEWQRLASEGASTMVEAPQAYASSVQRLAVLAAVLPLMYGLAAGAFGIAAVTGFAPFTPQLAPGPILMTVLGLVSLVLSGVLLATLLVRPGQPEGVALAPHEAEGLRTMLDRIASSVDAPRPQHVLIDLGSDLRAFAVPRMWCVGTRGTTLVLGLPALQSLTVEQFSTAIAHRLALVSDVHCGRATRIDRVLAAWRELQARLDDPPRREGRLRVPTAIVWWLRKALLGKVAQWLVPTLEAESFALRRAVRANADLPVRSLDPDPTQHGWGLMQLALRRTWLEQHELGWRRLERAAATLPQPDVRVVHEIVTAVAGPIEPAQAERWLTDVLAARSDPFALEPATGERLVEIGIAVAALGGEGLRADQVATFACQPVSRPSAALLGEHRGAIWVRVLEQWAIDGVDRWASDHERLVALERELTDLEVQARIGTLDAAGYVRAAELYRMLRSDAGSEACIAHAVNLDPYEDRAAFRHGEVLVERDDPGGVGWLEHAASLDPSWAPHANRLIARHLVRRGDLASAEVHDRRADEWATLLRDAERERAGVRPAAGMRPVQLPERSVNLLRATLHRYEEVQSAWVVQLEATLHRLPDHGVLMLGVSLVPGLSKAQAQVVRNRVEHAMSTTKFVSSVSRVVLTWVDRDAPDEVSLRIADVDGSWVYERPAVSQWQLPGQHAA